MRFSLGKLLYFIGFCAICFAVSQSEESGERVSLVTSLDFSPAGDQLLIAMHEFNGFDVEFETRFERTINLFDYPSLKPLKSIVRDHQLRSLVEPVQSDSKFSYVFNQKDSDTFF